MMPHLTARPRRFRQSVALWSAMVGVLVAGCQTPATPHASVTVAAPQAAAAATVDDVTLAARVKNQLVNDPVNALARVDVDAHRGVVYLNGGVASTAQKHRATQLALNVAGVLDVVNNVQVSPRGG